MSEAVAETIVRTRKTTAVLFAVVFLLSVLTCAGCSSTDTMDPASQQDTVRLREANPAAQGKKKHRRRASDYSRLPGNYPTGWQTQTIGH